MQGSSERGRAQPVLHVSAGVLDALLLPHEPSSFATLMSLLESEAQCSGMQCSAGSEEGGCVPNPCSIWLLVG